jgi:hypothetical protein
MSGEDLIAPANPFADPSLNSSRGEIVGATLEVGRNASLTLGTDSLIVLGWLEPADGQGIDADII